MVSKLSTSHMGCINYDFGYSTGEFIICFLVLSWLFSLALLSYRSKGKAREATPMLLRLFFVMEFAALFFWFNSALGCIEQIEEVSETPMILSRELICDTIRLLFTCMIAVVMRLLLLNWLELMARKMETKPETP